MDPHHRDAPDHLVDVLSALTDELVQIGLSDGFLSTHPGGTFDDSNRHTRARAIGALIAEIGQRGIFKVDGQVLATPVLMAIVMNVVQRKMGHHHSSTTLKFAWDGIGGWRICHEFSFAPPFGYDLAYSHTRSAGELSAGGDRRLKGEVTASAAGKQTWPEKG